MTLNCALNILAKVLIESCCRGVLPSKAQRFGEQSDVRLRRLHDCHRLRVTFNHKFRARANSFHQ